MNIPISGLIVFKHTIHFLPSENPAGFEDYTLEPLDFPGLLVVSLKQR